MKIVGSIVLLVVLSVPGLAQTSHLPLQNVRKVTVYVAISGKDTDAMETILKNLVELRLRMAGLTVLSMEEAKKDPDIIPSVELSIILLELKNVGGYHTGYAFSTSLGVLDPMPSRNGNWAAMELWTDRSLQAVGTDNLTENLRSGTNNLLDELMNSWLRANPKK